MSEITVRRVGAQVIMTLVCEGAPKVEVTMDEAEAASLGSQLMSQPAKGDWGSPGPYKPRKIADLFDDRQLSRDSVPASGS
ncbi:hypothetical protein PY365_04435 [Roseiarcaceae bacterium H3SJ34-1]|uniref:hypothetical protein n=1 Tax=Terripilifer ovatus TaxID=3032367 RepID=UPI003AB9740D|nr:hypothetical protein [Roseiarcaceae bacterium H3SJ34-1]